MTIKKLVKDNFVKFDSYRQGHFLYILRVGDLENYEDYMFSVPIEDIGTATMLAKDKAITFMRWIRKAQEEGALIKL